VAAWPRTPTTASARCPTSAAIQLQTLSGAPVALSAGFGLVQGRQRVVDDAGGHLRVHRPRRGRAAAGRRRAALRHRSRNWTYLDAAICRRQDYGGPAQLWQLRVDTQSSSVQAYLRDTSVQAMATDGARPSLGRHRRADHRRLGRIGAAGSRGGRSGGVRWRQQIQTDAGLHRRTVPTGIEADSIEVSAFDSSGIHAVAGGHSRWPGRWACRRPARCRSAVAAFNDIDNDVRCLRRHADNHVRSRSGDVADHCRDQRTRGGFSAG